MRKCEVYINGIRAGELTELDDMEYEFGENGGRFHLHYTLDMNTNLLSENELTIEVTPA